MNTFVIALAGLVGSADPAPAADDVKAGWGAFGIFLLMAAAVALLGWSLVRHLKKTKANAAAGVFGPEDAAKLSDGSHDDLA
ncbi:hypothetical protein [Marmoricola sp. RAF53]|uniref:hypothetical protein n=1 Tax=Marmoricola sp. RAF53 TaxID=3233059 RepID=UPI003F991D87